MNWFWERFKLCLTNALILDAFSLWIYCINEYTWVDRTFLQIVIIVRFTDFAKWTYTVIELKTAKVVVKCLRICVVLCWKSYMHPSTHVFECLKYSECVVCCECLMLSEKLCNLNNMLFVWIMEYKHTVYIVLILCGVTRRFAVNECDRQCQHILHHVV